MGETHFEYAAPHLDKLRVDWEIGAVIGIPPPELFGPRGVLTAAL
jgi:hypothetical protein